MTRNIKLLATLLTLVAVVFLFASTDANAQTAKGGKGTKGFVDLNGDGIPNGKDPDFVKPQDGTGRKMMNGKNAKNGKGGFGPGDGTGNCDGTGPKGGKQTRRGK
ncbi:MAG: hypothetical protein QME25_09895 [Bacteroidota bacterium]|nr:hypothetical protein [Bacteroidota bacterium]